ncbi:hypothetical protein HIM_08957 [Hirsutella minnesotensis 3608]|uniref:Uncharacterized protein n=1 Tax=Hirsutella minnesotensis 3608 TaxID=1043627 RepID=A0A0F7ZM32_9HYPO|nr:hypothetical protein HIM_08957 [Hirsutella minnesotensis 3608]
MVLRGIRDKQPDLLVANAVQTRNARDEMQPHESAGPLHVSRSRYSLANHPGSWILQQHKRSACPIRLAAAGEQSEVIIQKFDAASAAAAAAPPAGTQSKRPIARESDSHSDTTNTTNTTNTPAHPPRTKHVHQKHHHVGRLHARVPSSKSVHKQNAHATAAAPRLNRRPTSPSDPETPQRPPPHRRVTSEVKLPSRSPTPHISKSASHTSLKRNRSHVDVSKRNRSSDKLKRTSSGTGLHASKSSKSQVHFDLGSDDPEDDEWVDASGSNSPYLSRKGSLNSSAQSSLRPAPVTPNSRSDNVSEASPGQLRPSPDPETSHRKEYLTSRLLQRTPSYGAPPKMTAEIAQAARPRLSPSPIATDPNTTPPSGSNHDELVSRFVDVSGSGLTSQGSFYYPPGSNRRLDETPRRPKSVTAFTPTRGPIEPTLSADIDDSVLVPRSARRAAAPPAESSRIQQKLNLQRASSVLEPGQAVTGVGGVVGSTPLIGVGGPGFDGANSRDPRVGKLLERTGMEYLVVRRYQNPVARSLSRLGRSQQVDKGRRITLNNTPSMNGKRSVDVTPRHMRHISMPESRQANAVRRSGSVRTVGTGSSFEGDDAGRLGERLSGASLVGTEEEDGTAALLRNLWEKSMDLSASTD